MNTVDISQIARVNSETGRLYTEFMRLPSLSVGLYMLAAGMKDPQSPHSEDEVYYVISGRGMIKVAEEDRAVQAGNVILVEKEVEHRFHTITEDLTILVFFAPAEMMPAT